MTLERERAASSPATSRNLISFEEFRQKVTPHLTLVRRKDLGKLLKGLYEVAKKKIRFESVRKQEQDDAIYLRVERKKWARLRPLLQRALVALTKAQQQYPLEMEAIEGDPEEASHISFDDVTRLLKDTLGEADDWKIRSAWNVHPGLRNRREKKLASQKPSDGRPIDFPILDFIPPRNVYPVRSRSSEVDHWFIGAAAECLDDYRTGSGKKIPRYDRIISELFKTCFGDHQRNEENVRTELGRQKKAGKPKYEI